LKATVALVEQVRHTTLAMGAMLERVDHMARQWTAAGLSLLAMAILLGTAMLAAH
jgi:hypothetical protein